MIPADKRAHVAASAALTLVAAWMCAGFSAPMWYAAAGVFALGLAREGAQWATARWRWLRAWADVWRPTRWAMIGKAEWGDVAANGAGVALGWGGLFLVGLLL